MHKCYDRSMEQENKKQEPKEYEKIESYPGHPDVLTDRLDMYDQIGVNKEFTNIWTSELADVEIVGNGLIRAHRKGKIDDAKQERGGEYTADVGDSPADAAAAEKTRRDAAEVSAAAAMLEAAPTGDDGDKKE